MARPAENILEDILAQLEQTAGSGVSQLTADDIAKAVRGNQTRSTQTNDPSSKLGDLASAAGDAAEGLLHSRSASDATSVLATGFKSMGTTILPGFSTAISLAADGAMKFYEFMDENFSNYKEINTAGLQTTNGMMGLYRSLATGRLNLDEFMSATADTRDVIASMGSDGTQQFGSMLNQVMESEKTMGTLNMANAQMAKYLASNLKMQKSYGVFEKMSNDERARSNIQYMDDMNKYSKALGISTDALAEKLNQGVDTVAGFGTQLALSQRGMDPKAAADTSKNLNMVLGSFGEFGGAFNEQLARFIEFGQVDLESDVGKMFQNNDEIRKLFEDTRKMALDGSLATQAGKDQLQAMLASDGLVDSIDGNMTQFRAAFGDAATNQIIQFRNSLNNYNTDVNKVDDFWNQTMSNFNRTIENMFNTFKVGIADMFIDPHGFIKNIFGEKWGSWLLDGAFNWEVSDIPLVGSLTEFMSTFFAPVSWFWDALQGYGAGVASRFGSVEAPSWQNIVRALVPEWLADIIFDGDQMTSDIAGASHMGSALLDGANDLIDKQLEWMKASGTAFAKHESNVLDAASEATSSMMESISKWWNKPAAQTVIQKTVTQSKQALPVVNVETPDVSSVNDEVQSMLSNLKQTDMTDLLTQLLSEMRRVGESSEQQVRVLRKYGQPQPGQIN